MHYTADALIESSCLDAAQTFPIDSATMKRLLLILFVLLLPLESIWAVAGAFCGHEADAGSQQHFGHHTDQHQHAPADQDGTDKSQASGECGACHFGHCCFMLTSFTLQTTASPAVYAVIRKGSPPARSNARPERPKWPGSQPALA
ncbi:hypothetical protein VVD49_05125 [Uliginosibacterium sp. H3]|uniref:DUF2946 domain-containing protein n=1 Tax=Uliginosibacterium silvisoli TaxID=3114758 RepID=A0ABU6K0I4_9RHOO|nr:hypothetical protein [Uliginosibacterium sp. H3]